MSHYIETASGSVRSTNRPSAKRWWGIAGATALVLALVAGALALSNADAPTADARTVTPANPIPSLVTAGSLSPQVIAQLRAAEMVEYFSSQPEVIADLRAAEMVEVYSTRSDETVTLGAAGTIERFAGQLDRVEELGGVGTPGPTTGQEQESQNTATRFVEFR